MDPPAGARAGQTGISPIGPYVLDFYCIKAQLAIEVDGRVHETEGRPERDARRDAWLGTQGIEVLRIPAGDALAAPDAVADGILGLAWARMSGRSPTTGLIARRKTGVFRRPMQPVPLPRAAGEDA